MAGIGRILDCNQLVGERTTSQILETWKDGIFLKKEDITRNSKGLRCYLCNTITLGDLGRSSDRCDAYWNR